MPRLSTFLTLIAFSAGLSPVFSLDPGRYRISSNSFGDEPQYLTSRYGSNEELQFDFGDPAAPSQLWDLLPAGFGDTFQMNNVEYGCTAAKDDKFSGVPVVICGGTETSSVILTPVGAPDTYYIDFGFSEPRRMSRLSPQPGTNATLTSSEDGFPPTWFRFNPVPGP
ncbi:hypothetical protein OPQ81_008415 [Rhizoctonia solani]|nr:hypothetical protein OPQ81_008415 [Rhizoctonia solani]